MKFNLINEMTCTRLKLFGEDVRKLFLLNNWEESPLPEADLILMNSCSFLRTREDYFIKKINELNKERNSRQKVLIFGCLPATNPSSIKNINKNILLFSRDPEEIINYFNFKRKDYSLSTITDSDLSWSQKLIAWINQVFLRDVNITFRLMKKNVCHLRISSGCLGNCSYCSEKFTTPFKSRLISEVVESFKDGIKRGYRVFALNSDDSSCFGLDNQENIAQLLKKIVSIPGDYQLAISEFNPRGLFMKYISHSLHSKKICYITIPIQSGSQKILTLMNRPYILKNVVKKIRHLKEIHPSLKINTHLIVGFPGETEEDFLLTLYLVKQGLFDRIKVFKYSDRPNTESSKLNNKISEEIKIKRAKILQRAILFDSIKKRDFVNFLLNLNQI